MILVSFALMLFLLMSARESEMGEASRAGLDLGQDYDYSMTNLTRVRFDPGGEPRDWMWARQWTQYREPRRTVMEKPMLLISRNDQAEWFVSADNGAMTWPGGRGNEQDGQDEQDEQRVELNNNVLIFHVDSEKQETRAYTDYLEVYPEARRFSTPSEVRIVTRDGRFFSTGVKGDLDTDVIQLLSGVRGYYEPGSQSQ